MIETLPDQRLDDGLAAHVEIPDGFMQFVRHAGSDVQ